MNGWMTVQHRVLYPDSFKDRICYHSRCRISTSYPGELENIVLGFSPWTCSAKGRRRLCTKDAPSAWWRMPEGLYFIPSLTNSTTCLPRSSLLLLEFSIQREVVPSDQTSAFWHLCLRKPNIRAVWCEVEDHEGTNGKSRDRSRYKRWAPQSRR